MGCLAEHYARDRARRCPMCRSDLASSELASTAAPNLPTDLETVMEDEGLRKQIIALVTACVAHAIKWDRRKFHLLWLCGAGASLLWVSHVEGVYSAHLRKLHAELARVCRENRDLRYGAVGSLFRRP